MLVRIQPLVPNMPYKNKEDRKAYYHRTAKKTLYEWRKNSTWWNDYQREYKKRKSILGVTIAWERIKNDPSQFEKYLKSYNKWRDKNKEKLVSMELESTATLSDRYIKKQLVKDGFRMDFVNNTPDLINLKRILLQIKRIIK